MENSNNTPTQEQLCQQVEQAWQSRVTAQGLRGKSRRPGKSYREKQAEFFTGAMAALGFFPPLWVFSIMRGDDILEERVNYPFKQEQQEEQRFARKCDFTGEGMNEGWCIGDGEMYAKYEGDALKHAKDMGYDSLDEAYEDEAMYYTEWEIDVNESYYVMHNGKLVEVEGE